MDLLAVHRASLERWRSSMNLVGPGSIEPHYEDCLAAVELLGEPSGRWADLGTGAGFPGIVFAARFPEVEVELVDSRRKRCVFLEHVLADARVGDRVRVRCARVEDLEPSAYDGVMSRALAAPSEAAAHAARLVRPGGAALLMVGPEAEVSLPAGWSSWFDHAYEVDGHPRRAVGIRRAG